MVMSEGATATAGDRVSEGVKKAGEMYEKGKEQAKEAAKKTDEAIRSHPYESIGIAFGVGILIGVLIGRR